ncbi:hypothetical protein ACLOJK_037098 [Asimina triloba]
MLHVPSRRRCAKLRAPEVGPDLRRNRARAGAYCGPLARIRLRGTFARRSRRAVSNDMLHVPSGRRCAKLPAPEVGPNLRRNRARAGAYGGPLARFRLRGTFARRAAAHDVGRVAPFPTTCCTTRPDDDARSYGRRKLARTFVATGPELAHTAARLRGSDFAGPSRDGPVAPFPTTCCTSRPDDDARSYRRRKFARTFVATGPELAHTTARLRGSDFAT